MSDEKQELRAERRRSTRYKQKVLARWRWLADRGMGLERAALEIGVTTAELRAWSRAETPLIAPVRVDEDALVAAAERGVLVVVLAGGVRVEGLTVAEVAELARRLS